MLNESLASTSAGECVYLAEDIVKALRRLGARAVYSTHLHDLANRTAEINASVSGESKVISVVSSPIEAHANPSPGGFPRSYRVEIRPPMGQSFAREIAQRFGISYEQLERVLFERKALSDNPSSPAILHPGDD